MVYVIDSFSPRGYTDRKSVGWKIAAEAQFSDIAPAYHYLSTRSNVGQGPTAASKQLNC